MTATPEQVAAFMAGFKAQPDLTIVIDGYEWQVHSSVISSQSILLRKLCEEPFQESLEKKITLYDDCPWMVARMLVWAYSDPNQNVCTVLSSPYIVEDMMIRGHRFTNYEKLKIRDQEREEWEKEALKYLLADKYQMPRYLDVVRSDLQSVLKKDPALLSRIVDKISISVLENDAKMCSMLVHAAVSKTASFVGLKTELDSIFSSSMLIKSLAHSILMEELDSRTAGYERMSREAQRVRNFLKQATEYNNIKDIKPVIEKAEKALESVLGKRKEFA